MSTDVISSEATDRLPRFLRELLDSCPVAGDGVHFWIFKVARHLLAHFDERATFELIKAKAAGCGRPLFKLEHEIFSQIRSALPYRWQPRDQCAFAQTAHLPVERLFVSPTTNLPRPRSWPKPDIEQIRAIVEGGFRLVDLAEQSPVRFDDEFSHTEEIIDTLFPGNPLLCVGKDRSRFATRQREIWRGHLHRLPLIVPNPMLDYVGHTTEGRWSEHTKEQTARPVYLVIEFDFSEFARDGKTPSCWASLVRQWRECGMTAADSCAALHLHLAERLPLVCVTHSGGKSLHGWYYVFDRCQAHLRHFMEYAVSLGADRATWTRSQFVRIPDGLRGNGQRQRVFYFNPGKAVKL
jgi:hypothetical protein